MEGRGVFVVLEGIDGAGTTTQSARVASALRARGIEVVETHEPTGGPIGTTLRQALSAQCASILQKGMQAWYLCGMQQPWPTLHSR